MLGAVVYVNNSTGVFGGGCDLMLGSVGFNVRVCRVPLTSVSVSQSMAIEKTSDAKISNLPGILDILLRCLCYCRAVFIVAIVY